MVDNMTIARIFRETGDLLEIAGENPFKIRAYRNAADTILACAEQLADLTPDELRAIPGIGKDLAARIREIVETGASSHHRALLEKYPPTILDLLGLQGVGPKTVAVLFKHAAIASIDDLERAARHGRLHALPGIGKRKEELILKAVDEWKRHAGRHLAADAHELAERLVNELRDSFPEADIVPVGSIRRGCETCGDIDLVATGASADLMENFTTSQFVERVLARGDTKSSVLLRDGYQADLRAVPVESRGAALQYFTGSKAHNIALRDRALQRGFKLNEYGLFRLSDNACVAGETEQSIYKKLDLAFIPPELRENRGEIRAAEEGSLPRLVELSDIRGDVHTHTNATDGRDDIEAMALAARASGLQYIAITDHSKALAMANGLDERRAVAHARRVREVGRRVDDIVLLAGIECDILPDGRLDLADDCLAQLDIVIASVHSGFNQEEKRMTERVLRAMESPVVDIIGHPTGRLLLRRESYRINMEQIAASAASHGVALEINCQTDRLDLNDVQARLASDRGVDLVIGTDAHAQAGFRLLRWGVLVARRAWLESGRVLNTRPVDEFQNGLRRNKTRGRSGSKTARV